MAKQIYNNGIDFIFFHWGGKSNWEHGSVWMVVPHKETAELLYAW